MKTYTAAMFSAVLHISMSPVRLPAHETLKRQHKMHASKTLLACPAAWLEALLSKGLQAGAQVYNNLKSFVCTWSGRTYSARQCGAVTAFALCCAGQHLPHLHAAAAQKQHPGQRRIHPVILDTLFREPSSEQSSVERGASLRASKHSESNCIGLERSLSVSDKAVPQA